MAPQNGLNSMIRSLLLIFSGILGLLGLLIGYVAVLYFQLPNVEALRGCLTTEMFHVQLCPKSPQYVKLGQIAPIMRHALIVSEDANFYHHNGFDLDEIKESLKKNLDRGGFARGGSTLTQQLAKNVFLSADKSLIRKVIEARLTYQIEHKFSKDEILEKYLNVVQFGQDLFGIKAAAQFYFKKHPSQLNVLESAFLAMLLPSPEKYSVSFRKKSLTKFAQARIQDIVRRLYRFGRITEEEYSQAKLNVDGFPWDGSHPTVSAPTGSEDSEELKLEEQSEQNLTDEEIWVPPPSEEEDSN